MRSTINSYLEDYLERGDKIAFAHRRGLRLVRWSYRRVAETAYGFARELEARGVTRGERVLLWAANGPEWVAAFYGCVLRGAVVVPLDVESAADFVARVQAQTRARLVLHSAETREQATALGLSVFALEELERVAVVCPRESFRNEAVAPDSLVEIIYTSGTTAEPRGVCLTHGNLLANLAPLEEEMRKYMKLVRLIRPLRFACLLPLSHVFGQFMGMLVPQLLGGEVLFLNTFNPSEIVNTVKGHGVNVVVTVPRLLDSLREHVERREESRGLLSDLRRRIARAEGVHPLKKFWLARRVRRYFGWRLWAFVTGGATLSRETEIFWRRLGYAVIQGYGMTETASLVTVNHPFKTGRGSIGKTLRGQELKLDEASGEILVRGANVSPGYWRADGGHEPLGDGGWLRTGDLGERDAAGNIYFRGRKKETIVTAAGLNVHPEDIEAALNRQPEVRLSAVVGVEGARGPEPLAVLIMNDTEADPAQVVARANESLARHQHVRRWQLWPDSDFPRTPTQKIRKRDILAALSGGIESVGGDGDSLRARDTVATVPHLSAANSAQLSLSSSLDLSSIPSPAELDSLGRVELLSALEDRYQIEIDEASFTSATTAVDVERIVSAGGVRAEETAQYPYPTWTQTAPVRWFRVIFYYTVVLPITSVLCWARVKGREKLRDLRGPALFVSNHITYFDHALIMSAMPGRFRRRLAIAQEGERLRWWRNPPKDASLLKRLRWRLQYFLVVLIFNTFSLPKVSGFRRSFAYAGDSVDRGYNLLVFPEGIRAERPGMIPFRPGIGILAAQLRIPVVPVRIDGLIELKLSGRRGFTSPHRVTICLGDPVTYPPEQDPAQIAADLERRVREL